MNILILREQNPFIFSNASNNRFLSLAEGLAENGCNVDLLLLRSYSCNLEKIKYNREGKINGINYRYLNSKYIANKIIRKIFNKFFFSSPVNCYNNIKNILMNKSYDYVWLHFSPNIIKIGSKLMQSNIHTKYFHEQSEYSWIGLSDKKIHNKYLNDFIPRLDIFVIMTGKLISYYKEYIGDKTKIIHLPMTVDFRRFNKTIDENKLIKPYIAYCGTMNNEKDGVNILILSFIKIMGKYPHINLYIAGPLAPRKDYKIQKSIIKMNHAENRISFLGTLSKDEIPSFLSNAMILAMARPASKQAEGGFPTKLGEYLATGNPVCVTDVGEIGLYLDDNVTAYIAKPNSVDSFIGALERAISSQDSHDVGKAGEMVAYKYFNKEIQSKVLFEFLRSNKQN